MPGYTSELYNYISSIDNTFKNDVSFDQFKSKMADKNYSKTMYDWIGQNDNTFQSDVSFDQFREKLGYKKKSSTGLSSQPQGKSTTSATVKTTTQKPSVSSGGKKTDKNVQMFTGFPGKEGKQYALDMSSGIPAWKEYSSSDVVNGKTVDKFEKVITDPNRVNQLNKYFKQTASTSNLERIRTGLPTKEENQYRVKGDKWERLTEDSNQWEQVNDENAVNYLNKYYGESVKVTPKTLKDPEPKVNTTIINTDLISKTEEEVVPTLQRNFGKYGFTFTESGLGTDYVKVTSRDGVTKEFSLDERNPEEALRLKSFIEGNKVATRSAESQRILDLTKEATRSDLGIEYRRQKSKELKDYRNSNQFVTDLKNMNFNEVESNINAIKKSYIFRKDKEGLEEFYNSPAYKIYRDKKNENTKSKSDKIDALYYELNQAKTADQRQIVKSKIDTYMSDKFINKQTDNYSIQLSDAKNSAKKLQAAARQYEMDLQEFNSRVESGNISQEEYESSLVSFERRAEYIDSRRSELNQENTRLVSDMKKLETVAGKYIINKEKTGSFGGMMVNSTLNGLSKIFEPAVEAVVPFVSDFKVLDIDPDKKRMLKNEKGYTDEQIENYVINESVKNAKQGLRQGLIEAFGSTGTTTEYMQSKDRGFIEKALVGVAESLPAMFTPGGAAARFSTLAAQAYSSIEDEMLNDKDFETSTALERSAIAVPYAMGMGALENLGVSVMLSKNPIAKSLITRSIVGAVGKVGGDATKEVFENVLSKEIKSNMAKFGIRVVGGTLAEAETGALQSLALDIGWKGLANKIANAYDGKLAQELTDGEYFDTPDSFKEGAMQVLEDAAAEAIGGFVMTTIGTSAQGLINGRLSLYDEKDAEFLKSMTTDPEVKKMFIAKLKTDLLNGKITKSEAESQLQAVNEVSGIFNSTPENITGKNLNDSVQLIIERKALEKEIEGKDENLVAAQKARIADINNQLKTISENATKKSTEQQQEVTAEGGVVQREVVDEGQPEVGQGEGAVGQATQQGADLGDRPVEGRGVQKEKIDLTSKSIDELEKRQSEIEGSKKEEDRKEFNEIDKELEKREWQSVLNAPLVEINDVVDGLIEKNTKMPNGFGSYIDKSDAKQTKQVAEKYSKEVSKEEAKKDFKDAFFGNPSSSYSDALKLRESVRAFIDQGGSFKELLSSVQQEFESDGFTDQDAANVINRKLQEIQNKGLSETTTAEKQTTTQQSNKKTSDRISEIQSILANDDATFDEQGTRPLLAEARVDLEAELATLQETAPDTVQAEPTTVEQPAVESEVEQLGKLLSGTDQQIEEEAAKISNKRMSKIVSNAARALSKIAPNVKFVIHDSDDSYRKATGEENRSQSSNGEYNPKTKTVHINLTKANARTVAHEVFHAILLDRVSSDAQANAVTKRMIEAIANKIEGNPELKKYLDDFASNYDQNIQNEEKLAELVGKLAENYMKSPQTIKDIIKRWLNKLASMFSTKPITTEQEVMEVLNTIARKVATGKKIRERQVSGLIGEKADVVANMNKRLQADFSDAVSKLTFVFDKNTNKFKKLEEDGFITKDKSLSDFDGKYIFLHQPDAAFSGAIYKDGELLIEGKGGVFYPIKFHEDGYFWASTDSTAETMAKDLNKVMDQNGGTIYMALTSAPSDKLMSSTTMANAVLDFFSSKAFDKNFKITPLQLKTALRRAANDVKIKKSKNKKTGKITEKPFGLDLKLPAKATLEEIQSAIRTALGTNNSSFEDRKNFALELTKLMANEINKNDVAVNQFGKLFSQGIQNKYFKGITKTGKLKISAANMTQALSEMFTEPMLKEGVDRDKGGQVYAVLELNGPVKPTKSDKHESYPMAIQSDSDNKVKLHILNDRKNWYDVFEDFETNDIVTEDRRLNIYPTSGVSVRGLRLNLSKTKEGTQQRKQLSGLLDRKQNQNASSIVSVARKNGFSEAAIEEYLRRQGFTDQQIQSAMSINDNINVNEIFDRSKKALREKKSQNTFMKALRFVWNKFIDRQSDIKRLINGIKTPPSAKAFNLLVTRAGAKGFANYRYKEAEDKIYKGLKEKDIDTLDKMIYIRRIIAINENRADRGMNPYKGIDGYSEAEAKRDLEQMKEDLGVEKYNDMMKRADEYFKVFAQSLKNLYESERLTEEVYNNLKDIEYSPIATIKYIIGDDLSLDEIDRQAEIYGITRKDIATLTDKNENEIIMDSQWLLMMNLMSIEARAWENRMLNSFADAIESASEDQKKALSEFVVIPKSDQKVPAGFVTVNYFKDGKAKKMFVKADYAVQLLDIKTRQSGLEAIGKLSFTQVLRFFATAANPVFIIGNTAVDFKNIAFFSDTYSKNKFIAVPRLAYDFLKNFLRKTKNTKKYNEVKKEFMEHGGGMDFMSSDGLRVLKNLRPGYKVTSTAQSIMVKYANAMSYLGETSELAFRIAVYEKTKENLIKKYKKENEGKEPNGEDLDNIMFESAREARQTVDFSQGGNWAKSIDIVMPYMNASLQGFRRPLEYAKKSPIGFASSMVQASLMSGSVAAMSLAALMSSFGDDDEDEKKAKAIDALNSISEYEKGNYHIVFTGKKNKDGEYEYKRIKKLPVLSMVSTLTEQMVYKYLLSNDKRPYAFDSKAMKQAAEKSIPFSLSDIFSRNPLASAFITYYFNEDTFTGEEIFRQPRDKKIDPTAEGIYDDKVEEFYKQIAPALGLSPIRSKAFIEKIVTSENTNPTIAIFNAALNGIFDKKTGLGEEFSGAINRVFESAGKKITRYTNKDIIMYNEMDKAEAEEMRIETDIYKKEQKVYNEIKSIYKDGGKMTVGQLGDMVKENFEKQDWERYVEKYYTYIQNMGAPKQVLDILYEKTPEVQALKFYNRYGSTLDDEEIQEISSTMRTANKKISDKTFLIYKRKYQRGN
jgi:hypothetical protein